MENRHAVLLRILCLANCLSRELGALNTERSSAGISHVNAQIMSYLAMYEGQDVFQRDIEEVFSIRRSTVSKVVSLMEAKGLIEREAVEQDARLKKLKLTQKAREIHEVAAREFTDFERRVTQSLTDEEIIALTALLDKIGSALESDKKEENL